MRAVRVAAFGDADVLHVEDVPRPEPQPGEALVRIKAAGVNFSDIGMRAGRGAHPLPYTPGLEAAGIVDAVGSGVRDVQPGDRIVYLSRLGSYAEFNTVPAAELIPLPARISFAQGAAGTLQGVTAQTLVHEYYNVVPGTTVLVHAAAGGLGLLLVQWFKHLGAVVIGTVSTADKAAAAREAGADHVILYTEQDFAAETQRLTGGRGADYVVDGVGRTTFLKDLDAVRMRGHICLYGQASGPAEPLAPAALMGKSITLSGGNMSNYVKSREALLERTAAVFDGIQQGWLQVRIDHTLPLAEAAEAQRRLEHRGTIGKVVLDVEA